MIKVFNTDEELAEAIATEMRSQVETKINPTFCLAAGSTPAKSYKRFIEKCKKHSDLSKVKFVSLDEWVGVSKETVGSCYQMLKEDLFSHLPIKEEQIIFFETVNSDLEKECVRIDQFIEDNNITFSLMGVGMNGHIGLNEPGCAVINHSSLIPLSDKTKEVMNKYFNEKVIVEDGITLGLQQVINSERVIVVITGSHKKEIVKELIENANADLPVQKLLGYEHIDFYLDKDAASLVEDTWIKELNQ